MYSHQPIDTHDHSQGNVQEQKLECVFLLFTKCIIFRMSSTCICLRLEKGLRSSFMLYKREGKRWETFSPLLSAFCWFSPTQMWVGLKQQAMSTFYSKNVTRNRMMDSAWFLRVLLWRLSAVCYCWSIWVATFCVLQFPDWYISNKFPVVIVLSITVFSWYETNNWNNFK